MLATTTGDTRLTNLCRTEQYLRSASIQLLNLGCQAHCESSAQARHTCNPPCSNLQILSSREMSCERHESATLVKEAPFVLCINVQSYRASGMQHHNQSQTAPKTRTEAVGKSIVPRL